MGGIDGIITIFNIISSIEGTKLNYKYIFILGLAALLSDAISMGFGEYASVKAEQKYTKSKDTMPIKNGIIMFISFVGSLKHFFHFVKPIYVFTICFNLFNFSDSLPHALAFPLFHSISFCHFSGLCGRISFFTPPTDLLFPISLFFIV